MVNRSVFQTDSAAEKFNSRPVAPAWKDSGGHRRQQGPRSHQHDPFTVVPLNDRVYETAFAHNASHFRGVVQFRPET